MIRDKTKRKTHQLDLDFVAQRPLRLRMEATTPGLGVHVASFAMDGEKMSYILTRQKRFVSGPAEPRVMKDLIQIALAPETLIDLLFDRPLDEAQWTCSFDDKHLPLLCAHRTSQLRLSWSERTAENRIVEIDAPAARLTMSLRETSTKVEVNDALFQLSAPGGFQSTR